jgi:hypothetical protein
MPMVFTRGRSAKKRLQIDWDVPVYTAPKHDPQRTGRAAGILTKDAAFAFIRGADRRPLLVLRECNVCAGSDFALLQRATGNDRTMLLTQWFHCVRLPASITHAEHGLHNLFAGARPPHLFFATNDGKEIETLPGDQTQSVVWTTMTKVLRRSYRDDPTAAVKQLLELLNDFDGLDQREAQLRRRLDAEIERHGPASAGFKRLKAKFSEMQKERKALLARERKLRDLGIKR